MTLETQIALSDAMTPVLDKILQSVNLLSAGMYDIQKAAGNADASKSFEAVRLSVAGAEIALEKYKTSLNDMQTAAAPAVTSDTGGITQTNAELDAMKDKISEAVIAQTELNDAIRGADMSKSVQESEKLKTEINGVEKEIRENVTQEDKFNAALRQGKGEADGLLQKIADMGKAAMGLQILQTVIRGLKSAWNFVTGAAEEHTRIMTAQHKLAQVMKNTMGAGFGDFDSIRKVTYVEQKKGVVSSGIQLSGAQELATYLSEADSLKKLIPVMNDMLAQQYGLNASQEQAAQIATMLGKVMDGQTGALSRYGYSFNEAQEEILKFGTEAQRTATLAQVVTQSVGGMNEALANTSGGQMKQIANEMSDLKAQIGSALQPALLNFFQTIKSAMDNLSQNGALDAFVNGITFVINLLGFLAKGAEAVINFFMAGAKLIADNWDVVSAVLIGIGTAIAVAVIPSIVSMVSALWTAIPPLLAQAAAWLVIHWPILLIGAAVMGLVMLLGKMGVTFADVCDFIGTLIGGLVGFILNCIAYVVNPFLSFAEFFINVFKHPIVSIKKLFADLATNILSFIQTIAGALDKVFGSHMADSLENTKNKIRDWVGELPDDYKEVKKIAFTDLGDAAQAGGRIGRGIGEGIENGIAGFANTFKGLGGGDMFGENDFGNNLNLAGIGSVDNVGTVGKVGGTVDISSEDLKYLRDIAERDSINKYTTNAIAPQVTFTFGDINKDADAKQVKGILEAIIREEIDSASNGTHY